MITAAEEAYTRAKAYVPEHIVSLMVMISKGDPFLIEDHLGLAKANWLILVGYPLEGHYSSEKCGRITQQAVETFHPEYLWFIGPEIPPSLLYSCGERQTDQYYALDIEETQMKPSLQRAADKAAAELIVKRGQHMTGEHEALISELLKRETLSARVKELYRAMPGYVGHSSSAWILDARDKRGKLSAFMVVELGANNFSAYILGSHSKKHYVPHASDLLFLEMINLTREQGKNTINLGLGVNAGIRRFKEKWGGKPFLRYEFGEFRFTARRKVSLIDALMRKLHYP
ncbi:MAG: hypothetical protein IH628_10150 [Proteobacteria bacterium]|nr:hypothetical protein [Pseudomonadota bacterium]